MGSVMAMALRGSIVLMVMRVTGGEVPYDHELRYFNGSFNNLANPHWGSVGQLQMRYIADADYADEHFSPPGDDRPSARQDVVPSDRYLLVMTEVFLACPGLRSPHSALFVAWAQLISIDISLIKDNASEPFPVPCDDGGGVSDIWCPSGAESEPIEFFRSEARIEEDNNGNRVRNPINHATAYIDLDFMYGRTEEEARSLRELRDGRMNITEEGLPFLNEDGTWKIADQRTARFPVTFALHVVLLREHNRCCKEVAPGLNYSGDQDLFDACRRWTIACVQHITEEDFAIRLLDGNVFKLWTDHRGAGGRRRSPDAAGHRLLTPHSRALEWVGADSYDEANNVGVDVFAVTAGSAAFESAVPTALRVLNEGYEPADDDMIELHEASRDLASFVKRNDIGPILRGAALSTSTGVDSHYSTVVSNLSPLFKLPVDAVQRGRDHGLPNYNDVREAYGLSRAPSFEEVTGNEKVQRLLSDAYGGDIDLLDAYVGALAEGSASSSDNFMGELLQAVWLDQLYRTITGDRHYHNHSLCIEDVELIVVRDLINRTAGVYDMPLTAFEAPDVSVCLGDCSVSESDVILSDGFELTWEEPKDNMMNITLKAKNIGEQGMLAIGFGGESMDKAKDYTICEVKSNVEAECIDRRPVSGRVVPEPDNHGAKKPNLMVHLTSTEKEWTMVKFERDLSDVNEDQMIGSYNLDRYSTYSFNIMDLQDFVLNLDYDLGKDIDGKKETSVIFAYRAGEGVDQHPNTNRGSAMVNFATGASSQGSEASNEFYSLHGALILFSWLIVMPVGFYYVRYRKGETVIFGNQWYEMHAECMAVAAEGVLPMAITAIVATGGEHASAHARWGFYMLASVIAQLVTGWLRVKALEGSYSNFSTFSRVNKYFHIWSGRLAYVLGLVQCYRGLRLVEERDTMVFSALELSFEFGNFGAVYHQVFPVWGGAMLMLILFLECRRQIVKLRLKGVTSIFGCLEFVNESFVPQTRKGKIIPRDEDLPLYTTEEFNEKVLNGQIWVMVDGAVVDIGEFYQRHPGGSRLVINAVGTDVTNEILGENTSLGHVMAFSPHRHGEATLPGKWSQELLDSLSKFPSAWKIVRSLVVGYIDDEADQAFDDDFLDDEDDMDGKKVPGVAVEVDEKNQVGETKAGEEAVSMDATAKAEGDPAEVPDISPLQSRPRSIVPNLKLPISARLNFAPMNPMDWRVRRFGSLGTLPDPSVLSREGALDISTLSSSVLRTSVAAHPLPDATLPFANFASEPGVREGETEFSSPKIRAILERFHVCPMLFRELMSLKGHKRPVYRYVFSCPGAVAVLVQSINGPCFFNLRASRGQGAVVQRAYNGFPVRLLGPVVEGARNPTEAGTRTVVPATESKKGQLCIEMRIREQEDGAMSKILSNLAQDRDNPAVQLQGPFLIEKIIPPPLHRNVIMIGAGTGVNPMVQTIRAYQELARSDRVSNKARLVLVWQATNRADLFCADELAELQLKGNGLLEVLVLTSDEHRRRSFAGVTLRRVRARLRTAVSPVMSSLNTSSDPSTPAQRSTPGLIVSSTGRTRRQRPDSWTISGIQPDVDKPQKVENGNGGEAPSDDSMVPALPERHQGGRLQRIGEEMSALGDEAIGTPNGDRPLSDVDCRDARRHKAIAVLEGQSDEVFSWSTSPEVTRGLARATGFKMLPGWTRTAANVVEEAAPRPNVPTRAKLLDEQVMRGKVNTAVLKTAFGESLVASLAALRSTNTNETSEDVDASTPILNKDEENAFCGSNIEPGKLQVIVSGPRGFVFHVENVLADMGVPKRAIVVLD